LGQVVEALAILLRGGADYELLLAGAGWPGEEELLRGQARQLGVEAAVVFLGSVAGEELAGLFASAHVGVAASACETFCIPVVEGLRAGLPHVVADEPWSAETVGDAVVRVDARDPESIAEGIRRLEDPLEWQRMAERGRERAARYTWKGNAGGIADVAAGILRSVG
jgi:glycosyltransferase involved in cell wall biosynthesis